MGQVPICKCGYVKLWHGVVFSAENSQHISDWYLLAHHSRVWILRPALAGGPALASRRATAAGSGARISVEIFENTDMVINRYREVTISLDYYGDSVLNSVCDILAMVAGFLIASRLGLDDRRAHHRDGALRPVVHSRQPDVEHHHARLPARSKHQDWQAGGSVGVGSRRSRLARLRTQAALTTHATRQADRLTTDAAVALDDLGPDVALVTTEDVSAGLSSDSCTTRPPSR